MNTWFPPTSPSDLERLFIALEEQLPKFGENWLRYSRRGYSPVQLAAEIAIDFHKERDSEQMRLTRLQETLQEKEEHWTMQEAGWQNRLKAIEKQMQDKEEKIRALNRIIARQQEQLNAFLDSGG